MLILFRAVVCSAERLHFSNSCSPEWPVRCKQKTPRGRGGRCAGGQSFSRGMTKLRGVYFHPFSFCHGTGRLPETRRGKPQLRKQNSSKGSGSLRCGGISSHSWAVMSSPLWCDTMNPVFNSFKPLFLGLWCWQQNPISGWHLFSFPLGGWWSIVPGTCYRGERSAVGQIVLSSCLVI